MLMQSRVLMPRLPVATGGGGTLTPTDIQGNAGNSSAWQSLTVPTGATAAKIELQGGGGDKSLGSTGGGGAYARKNSLSVTAGQTLYYFLDVTGGTSYVSLVSGATSGTNVVVRAASGSGAGGGLTSGSTGDVTVAGAGTTAGTPGWTLATGQSTPSPAGVSTAGGSAGQQDYGAGGFNTSTRGGYAFARFTWS